MRHAAARSWLLLALVLAAGCQRQDAGGPLAVSGRLFVFNYRVAIATYLVTLARTGTVPPGSRLEARFENPQGGTSFVVTQTVVDGRATISLESPPVHCVVKDRPYRVTIALNGPDGARLQTIETTVTSSDDQTILPARPMVVGPLYAPKPEVFKSDGTRDVAPERGCPT